LPRGAISSIIKNGSSSNFDLLSLLKSAGENRSRFLLFGFPAESEIIVKKASGAEFLFITPRRSLFAVRRFALEQISIKGNTMTVGDNVGQVLCLPTAANAAQTDNDIQN
jgi:hypothetical protein